MVSGAVSEWSHMKECEVAGRENSWMHVARKSTVMIRCILVGTLTLFLQGVNIEFSMT
jgi:hypothetical protein